MDVWVVAAAAGAGYVAQRLKNLTRGRHNSLDLSSDNLNFVGPESSGMIQKVQDKSHPFGKVLSSKSFGEEVCIERERACEDASSARMASTSGFDEENLVPLNNFASCSRVSSENSLAGFFDNEDIKRDWEKRLCSDIDEVITSDSVPQTSSRKIGIPYGFRRSRSSLRSRRMKSQFIKPRTSLESCLMAQLYNKHAEIEEYTYSVHSPQQPTMRPFVVTDGSRIISRVPHESLSEPTGPVKYKLQQDTYEKENKTVYGVPKLHDVTEFQQKAKGKKGKEQILTRRYSKGQPNGALFFLGLTMGIICSLLANKRETEKLNRLLKQTENLVQDLQEELEMKDSLTVKELPVEGYELLHDVPKDSHFNGLKQGFEYSSRCDNEEYSDQKVEDESLRKIEEELEAELERLESNINTSRLESKLSNVSELDPLVSDVVKGELRADLFGAKKGSQPYADRDGSGSSTPHSVRYPVSPRDLSLRLHEVIQSRLEERIKELETELRNSQRKFKYMESRNILPGKFLNYQNRTSSTEDSPIAREEEERFLDQPVVINLSGDALSAYNEVYEEFTKASESDEDDLPFGFEKNDDQEIFHQCKQVIDQVRVQVQDVGLNVCGERRLLPNGTPKTVFNQMENGEESEDGEDEMERLLIRQIVEKARQGSPAVLNAQRALLLTDER